MSGTTSFFESPTAFPKTLPAPKTASASTLRSLVAGILIDQGRKVYYVGSIPAMAELADDEKAAVQIPPEQRCGMRPMGRIAMSAAPGFQELFADGQGDPAILGVLCLPEMVTQALLAPESKGKCALILEGMDLSDPFVGKALAGIRAFAQRTGTLLASFP